MPWYFYVGLVASLGISIFIFPQLINLIKTKNTSFINLPMYCIYIVACFLFLIGGILLLIENNVSAGLPLVVAQSICGINSMIIFIWKLKNYFIAKKANISEFEYWKRKYGQEVKQ